MLIIRNTTKKASLIACLFCFLFNTFNFAQNPGIDTGIYNQLLSLEYPKEVSTDEPSGIYLRHLQLTLNYLLTENPETFEQLDDLHDDFLDELEAYTSPPWKGYLISDMKLQMAFANLKAGNELTSTWQIRQAFKEIAQNTEKHPEFTPNYKTLGLLQVLIGSIPEKYSWVVSLLGLEGTISEGINSLEKAAASQTYCKLEAEVLLAVIQAFLLNETDFASTKMQTLLSTNSRNGLLAYVAAAIEIKNSNAATAKAIISRNLSLQNPLLYYQLGEVNLQLGEYKKADSAFQQFLELFKGKNFIKDTYYKKFIANYLLGDSLKAYSEFNKAMTLGQTLAEADKNAEKELEKGKYPHAALIKIRLFSDGGNYEAAEKLISQYDRSNEFNEKQLLEYNYRKARLYHKTNQIQKAKAFYQLVIKNQVDHAYYAPNSCLQLGFIYRNDQAPDSARHYFEKVLNYKHYEYRNSIENKAKASLRELKP